MTSSPESEHLDNRHRNTLRQIFQHPVSHNIEWSDVLSLLEAIGEVSEEHNGKFKVSVGGETEMLHRPNGKDIGEPRCWTRSARSTSTTMARWPSGSGRRARSSSIPTAKTSTSRWWSTCAGC